MDLPVMPPVEPMLAKSPRPAIRAQVGRLLSLNLCGSRWRLLWDWLAGCHRAPGPGRDSTDPSPPRGVPSSQPVRLGRRVTGAGPAHRGGLIRSMSALTALATTSGALVLEHLGAADGARKARYESWRPHLPSQTATHPSAQTSPPIEPESRQSEPRTCSESFCINPAAASPSKVLKNK